VRQGDIRADRPVPAPPITPSFNLSAQALGNKGYLAALVALREHLHGFGQVETMRRIEAAIGDFQKWECDPSK
jgi:hypothetical protein